MRINSITTIEELDELIKKVKIAQKKYETYTQKEVDEIFKLSALAANDAGLGLAKLAVEETGMGIVEDKVIKNHFASEFIYNEYKDDKTCGILEEDFSYGIKKIAEPVGIIAGLIPTTNPTSTAIFKALITLKTRNAIIFSPHPRAKKCTVEAAKIVLEAAVKAGAPENIIGWIDEPTIELSNYLMKHPDINMILATGGPGMVKAAYSSGKPAIGVGPGNTPVIIDESADIRMAVNSILMSKTFDNGLICASEQSLIIVESIYDEVRAEFQLRGAYVMSYDERVKVGKLLIIDGNINPDIVGQFAYKIAKLAGISVPESTKILIAEVDSIDYSEQFSHEKLSPILAMYSAKEFNSAVHKAMILVEHGGTGHTSVLYTDSIKNQERVVYFAKKMNTGRVIINMPASQGAMGGIYNFKLRASLTMGCGSRGGNSVSENVGVKHLINIRTVVERRENMMCFRVPPKIYFKYGSLSIALKELKDKKRAFVITDKPLYELGYAGRVTRILEDMGMVYEVFYHVEPEPTIGIVKKGVEAMNDFKPDVIISIGGGSPMDAAKIMWLMYEHPEMKYEFLSMKFMDMRKKIYEFPKLGEKAIMVAIPTTSGTGSEVSPFAVITDEMTGIKYPIADYVLTPSIAIIDPELVLDMPKSLTAFGGFDAFTHGIESYVSVFATEYTNGLSLEAIRVIYKYLPASYIGGAGDIKAKEKMHYASTIAGMAFSNAFIGLCHSMAHTLGAQFHIPHGLANALLLSHVIKYNSTPAPRKEVICPQYKYPQTNFRYARIADYMELGGDTVEEKINNLINAVENLKIKLDIPKSIKDVNINEAEFYNKLDKMSEMAFDDQCTGANPRYPLIAEIREIYIRAFSGEG